MEALRVAGVTPVNALAKAIARCLQEGERVVVVRAVGVAAVGQTVKGLAASGRFLGGRTAWMNAYFSDSDIGGEDKTIVEISISLATQTAEEVRRFNVASGTPPDMLAHSMDHLFREAPTQPVALDCIGPQAVYTAVKAAIFEREALAHHPGEWGIRMVPHFETKIIGDQRRTAVIIKVFLVALTPA